MSLIDLARSAFRTATNSVIEVLFSSSAQMSESEHIRCLSAVDSVRRVASRLKHLQILVVDLPMLSNWERLMVAIPNLELRTWQSHDGCMSQNIVLQSKILRRFDSEPQNIRTIYPKTSTTYVSGRMSACLEAHQEP